MAEVNTDGGGGGKHGKKGRKKGGNPRVDMTPMVDLAFLLLTFFVLTSNLNKAKTMQMSVPKDKTDTSIHNKINFKLANTILLDGNKEGTIYVYEGQFKPEAPPHFMEETFDPKTGLRQFVLEKNSKVNGQMKTLRSIFKSGRLTSNDVEKLRQILAEKSQPDPNEDSVSAKRRVSDYDESMARLKTDLAKGTMSDSTFKTISGTIDNDVQAPFFIIKWGGDAKYGDIINVIDELKISDATKYALTKISPAELQALSAQTGRKYPELMNAATPAQPPTN